MMANLALDNNPALISEGDDISINSGANGSNDRTELNIQDMNDDCLELLSAEEQVEDGIGEDNASRASERENDDSVMSDDFSFNVQNIIESENSREILIYKRHPKQTVSQLTHQKEQR